MEGIELPGRGSVAYRLTGSGPHVVVLINGTIFNYRQWELQALPILRRHLAGQCRFLQYDYVGLGGSSAKTTAFNFFDLADELCDLLDALSLERVHLLGISKGSLVGQAFLIRHPERAASFCGISNPNVLSKHGEQRMTHFRERVEALEQLQDLWPERIDRHNYARVFNQVYVPGIFGKEYDELSFIERLQVAVTRRIAYPLLEGTPIQTIVNLFRYYVGDIEEEIPAFAEGLPRVRGIPILLINGTADTTTPVEMSRELAELLPAAELVELEGVTHMGPMAWRREARPVFERYVSFLEEHLEDQGREGGDSD
jgi:pimeloyl-ACP methyl ester carboxylesterase